MIELIRYCIDIFRHFLAIKKIPEGWTESPPVVMRAKAWSTTTLSIYHPCLCTSIINHNVLCSNWHLLAGFCQQPTTEKGYRRGCDLIVFVSSRHIGWCVIWPILGAPRDFDLRSKTDMKYELLRSSCISYRPYGNSRRLQTAYSVPAILSRANALDNMRTGRTPGYGNMKTGELRGYEQAQRVKLSQNLH